MFVFRSTVNVGVIFNFMRQENLNSIIVCNKNMADPRASC